MEEEGLDSKGSMETALVDDVMATRGVGFLDFIRADAPIMSSVGGAVEELEVVGVAVGVSTSSEMELRL